MLYSLLPMLSYYICVPVMFDHSLMLVIRVTTSLLTLPELSQPSQHHSPPKLLELSRMKRRSSTLTPPYDKLVQTRDTRVPGRRERRLKPQRKLPRTNKRSSAVDSLGGMWGVVGSVYYFGMHDLHDDQTVA
jgi:hypothetical protein